MAPFTCELEFPFTVWMLLLFSARSMNIRTPA